MNEKLSLFGVVSSAVSAMSQVKKSRKPMIDVDGLPKEIPGYMRADAGKGTETISTRDCAWIGRDGELYDVPLSTFNLEATPLDRAVAIARVHGAARSKHVAVSGIVPKLRMDWDAHKRGPKQHIDDYLVCRIAMAYHEAFFSDASKYPELDPIITAVVAAHAPKSGPERYSDDALLVRLRRKFNRRKDDLLSAVGAEDQPERGPALARARRELDELEQREIEIDRSRLDPALGRRRQLA
ncbi:hypothetical protein Q8W71_27895 [Methylobacterium sp. NEAU 140]|uniref:hypothetical protein n=1 Tax=Methylobacterium sp. NEAU 140 TaxID=3064945 RepID=UPI002735D045|nr:hypothetical protein [Methylobacterium sp. NEAU 140]MDP4026448.1 hypothetical protein [Methylobacterium sp. NEAU 140]